MSKSNIDKMCLSKTRYSTYEEVEIAADYIWETHKVMLYTYKCMICNGYHLTKHKIKRT